MLPEEKPYTWSDLEEIEDGKQYELLDGQLYLLASPSPFHGEISSNLERVLQTFFDKRKCRVYHAPQDVFLFNRPGDLKSSIRTAVQPDIFVLCSRGQRTEQGIFGAPTLVVEITSNSTKRNDRFLKYYLYQNAGVPEYWLVDPARQIVTVFTLEDAQYGAGEAFSLRDRVVSGLFPDLQMDTAEIFRSW